MKGEDDEEKEEHLRTGTKTMFIAYASGTLNCWTRSKYTVIIIMNFNLKPQTWETMKEITAIRVHKQSLNSSSSNESVKKKKK